VGIDVRPLRDATSRARDNVIVATNPAIRDGIRLKPIRPPFWRSVFSTPAQEALNRALGHGRGVDGTIAAMEIRIEQEVRAPREEVWKELSDLGSHASWMRDAREVQFLGESTSGVGTRMRVPTRIGPVRTNDILEVTDWVEGKSMTVRHLGIVSGTGQFRLEGDGPTVVIWEEELRFPWWLGGLIAAMAARPFLDLIWSGNLKRFAARFSET
jgi:carbon monoxide dehydrogenase subunit G